MKIVIAVCTRERPKMLERQLEAITRLHLILDVEFEVVIVENGPNPQSSGIVDNFNDKLSIAYYTEPRVGLVYARNAAVEHCLATGADWIGFLDDDEQIDENWLIAMQDAMLEFPAGRAFAGPVDRIDADNATKWYPKHHKQLGETGIAVWKVATGNILFHRYVYSEDGLNMRFDERFNLTGGEDTHLFLSMRRRGVNILWVQNAVCTDYVLPERATLNSRFGRGIRYMHCFGVVDQTLLGPVVGRIKNLLMSLKMIFHSFSYTLAGILFFPFSQTKAQAYAAIAVYKLSVGIGYCLATFLPLKPVYTEVDGH